MSSGVPKFTSFRPKPTQDPQPTAEPPKAEKRSRPETSHRNRSSERRDKRPRKSHDRSPGRHRGPEKSSKEETSLKSIPKEDEVQKSWLAQDEGPSKLFFSDRRGDHDLAKYGTLDRQHIPDYRRTGYGFVLGLPLDRKIDRDLSTEKVIVLTSSTKRREQRLLAHKRAGRERTKAVRFVKRCGRESTEELGSDFIAFSTRHQRKRIEDGDDANRADEHVYDYRGSRDAEPGNPTDSDLEYESDTVVASLNTEVIAQNSALVRKTKDHPEDVQAWIDLIEHQESMMKMERSSTELRGTDRQHLAIVRISIYEEALRKIKSTESDKVTLSLGMMTEATRAWSETQSATKWTEILAAFPFSGELWLKYLDFVQSNFTSFKYETCKAVFQKCLETMQLSPTGVDDDLCLYIFTRLTSMTHQAGYQELALAIWQALLEYHILIPVHISGSSQEALKRFEEFWESEVPRVGEENAKGWRKSNADDGPSPAKKYVSLIEAERRDTALHDFRNRETDRILKLRYPGRTSDEVGEDDPFHTILYSDIEAFLTLLSRSCKKTSILSSFLRFCNFPPLLRRDALSNRHVLDSFLQTEVYGASPEHSTSFTQLLSNYANCSLEKFQPTVQLLFDQSFPDVPGIVDVGFVRNVLHSLVSEVDDGECVGEYLLALESRYFPDAVPKTAKRLLKARPTSLRLYNAYGLAEARRDNTVKADQVFSSALSMQNTDALFATSGALDLLNSWVWEALRHGNAQEAFSRLVSPTGRPAAKPTDADESPDQAAVLRIQRSLSDACERALLGGQYPTATLATSLLAILAYLSNRKKPQSALAAFSQLSDWFSSHNLSTSPAAELHAQYIAGFLAYHAQHAPIVKPALLREVVEPLLAAFPDNTILLSVYAANEAKFAIDDRVRSTMHRNFDDKSRNIISWTFAIHYETLRGEIAGSTSHSIRALYKRALDDAGAHCPALWKQRLLFEVADARNEREKRSRKILRKHDKQSKESNRVEEATARVRDTFFRGMTQLPWCKTYMMMAFTHLGEEFLSQEYLKKVYNVMAEKELRLYIEMDEANA